MRILLAMVLSTVFLFGIDVKDMFGRDVHIKENKKIVCLGPGALRLASYLGLQDRLVGIEKTELKFDLKAAYRATFDKKTIKALPIVGQGGPGKLPNLETLVSLQPDIIFTSFLSKEQIDLISTKTKSVVVALSYGATYGGEGDKSKLVAVKKSLKLMAKIMDKQKRAEELISFMKVQEEKLSLLKLASKKIYIGGIGYKGAQGITSTESAYPSFKLLSLDNEILQGKRGHLFINKEALLAYDPQIIFLDLLGKKIVKEEIAQNKRVFQSIDAFKNQKVFWLYPYNFYNTNIENVYINSWMISSYFGQDVKLEDIKKEVYTKFLGKKAYKTLQKSKFYKL